MPQKHTYSPVKNKESRLIISILLNFFITIVEILGGIFSRSLSLISDALHNLTDTVSLVVSFIAVKLIQRKNTEQRTFGYKRAEILAALFNASILLVVSFFLLKEAISRFFTPAVINGKIMFGVASIGLAANAMAVFLLKNDSRRDMNIRSAYLHLFSDTLSSVAVIIGAIFIFFFKIYWLDPLLTVIIVLYVLKEGYVILGESFHILMQNVPKDINIKNIQSAIENISGIKNVHHAHVWAITERDIHFEAHINVVDDIRISESCILKVQIENLLKEKFNINHIILQFEYDSCKGISLIKTT